MKFNATISGIAMLLVGTSAWAAQDAYYEVEEIAVQSEGANYGPYPSAISDDGTFIGSYSLKASLSADIDIGLPFTFNRACQYDLVICQFEFYGSETAGDLSYENAYQAWRNAQSDAQYGGYSSYMMGNILVDAADSAVLPYDDNTGSTDVKVTDVTGDSGDEQFVVGYSSAPYAGGERDFVRRGFIKQQGSASVISLLPEFTTNGGFSSAYKVKDVTYENGETKTLVVGTSSTSFPQNNAEYFNNCYFSDVDDQISTRNELVNCPGFDTQAWAWDVTGSVSTSEDLSLNGFSLATQWLDNNEENNDLEITYSASALDINASGVAVGVSTFEYSDSSTGGRQRAIIMAPDADGGYGAPTELTAAVGNVGDDAIYNTWATAITDAGIVIGNREYGISKSVNKATEFFVYDIEKQSLSFPLKDLKVLTTEQRLNGDSSARTASNSRAYDINESGFIVGAADDYDQIHSVAGGSPRTQAAFLYNNNSKESWFINDLICSESNGEIASPRYKIRSARVINEDGTVLAEGWKYASDADYQHEVNATQVMLKLVRNTNVSSPNNSPNCWQSELLSSSDESYERGGAASFWLWLFALPLLLVRRFNK